MMHLDNYQDTLSSSDKHGRHNLVTIMHDVSLLCVLQ